MPGDAEGRRERFIKHLKPLQGALESYCRRGVRRSSDADDILQNAVLKAFRDFDRYSEGTNFKAWIFKYLNLEILAGNRLLSRVMVGHLIPFDSLPMPAAADAACDMGSREMVDVPELVLDRCESELAGAIRDLSDAERSSLLLHAIGDFKYREIAEILEMPIGTVMSHLSRARRQLRERLSEWAQTQKRGAKRKPDSA